MNKTIDNAAKVGSLLNSWTHLLVFLGAALISASVAYYKIFENEREIQAAEIEFKREIQNIREEHKKEIELIEKRSENRYARAMETADELKVKAKELEERVRDLEIDDAYIKGSSK